MQVANSSRSLRCYSVARDCNTHVMTSCRVCARNNKRELRNAVKNCTKYTVFSVKSRIDQLWEGKIHVRKTYFFKFKLFLPNSSKNYTPNNLCVQRLHFWLWAPVFASAKQKKHGMYSNSRSCAQISSFCIFVYTLLKVVYTWDGLVLKFRPCNFFKLVRARKVRFNKS